MVEKGKTQIASSSKIKTDSSFPLSASLLKSSDDNTSLLDIKDQWKDKIKSKLRENIDYVENHLPKTETDDTTYITGLLEEINRSNIEYLKELESVSRNIKGSKLTYLNEIGKNVNNWVEKMKSEISKFD